MVVASYCGGLCKVIDVEVGDPVTSLWVDKSGISVGTAKGRLVSIRWTEELTCHLEGIHHQENLKFFPATQRKPLLWGSQPIRDGQATHLVQAHLFKEKSLQHTDSYFDFFRVLFGHWGSCPDSSPSGVEHADCDSFEPSSSTGPSSWNHNHIPSCVTPDYKIGLYAAHNTHAFRAIYETQRRVFALSGNNKLCIYDRTVDDGCERYKLVNQLSNTYVYTAQAYRSSQVFIGSDSGSIILDMKSKAELLVDFCVSDQTLVPLSFDSPYLLCAVNSTAGSSLRIYNLLPSVVSRPAVWPEKPIIIHTIDIGSSVPLYSTFWLSRRLVVICHNIIYCYRFTDDVIKLVFKIPGFRDIPLNIFGGDEEVLWILTCNCYLYGISSSGKLLVALDLRPAKCTIGYPVISQVLALGSSYMDRIFIFNGDGGVFMAGVSAMMRVRNTKLDV